MYFFLWWYLKVINLFTIWICHCYPIYMVRFKKNRKEYNSCRTFGKYFLWKTAWHCAEGLIHYGKEQDWMVHKQSYGDNLIDGIHREIIIIFINFFVQSCIILSMIVQKMHSIHNIYRYTITARLLKVYHNCNYQSN